MVHAERTPDRYRWVILGVLWTSYVVVFLHRLSVGPLAPFFKEDLHIANTRVGLLMSAASIGYMLSMLPVGWFVDKIGAKWPIVTGELIAGACMIGLFFVTSYMWVLTLMFVTGFGCGFLLPSTTQGVMAWFPLRERATVMGLKQTAVNIGGIVSAATLPTVALVLDWRYGFLFLGILSIAIGVTAFILYREPRMPSANSARCTSRNEDVPLSKILKSREIWLLASCGLCLTWVEMTLIAHLVLYLTEVLVFGVVFAGWILAVTEAAGAIARPGTGLVSDRLLGGNRKQVLIMMAGATSVMCVMIGLLGPYLRWMLYPVLIILGMGGIAWGGVYLTLLSEFGGQRGAGKAVGLGGMVTLAGSAVGPPTFGYIIDRTHSYTLAWLSLACVAACCLVLLLFLRESEREL